MPGTSPGNGVTTFVKFPLPSAVTVAATWLIASQMRFIDSPGRNAEPVAVILVLGPPAAVSRTMLAPIGVGVGQGPLAGHPVWNPALTIGDMARRNAAANTAPTITSAEVMRNL